MSALASIGVNAAWFFSDDGVSRRIALCLWSVTAVLLLPAVVRYLRGKARYSDPLLTIGFVLVLNRIAFGVQALLRKDVLGDLCRWSGIAAVIVYMLVVLAYMRAERG